MEDNLKCNETIDKFIKLSKLSHWEIPTTAKDRLKLVMMESGVESR